jgi:hypothetical protein
MTRKPTGIQNSDWTTTGQAMNCLVPLSPWSAPAIEQRGTIGRKTIMEESCRVSRKRTKTESSKTPHPTSTNRVKWVKDGQLSHRQKKKALKTWEQDARQIATANNEGMAARDEGGTGSDPKLADVVQAKDKMSENPKHKRSR